MLEHSHNPLVTECVDAVPAEFAAQSNSKTDPTIEAYADLSFLIQHLDKWCFDGELQSVLITLANHGRAIGSVGIDVFESSVGRKAHELRISPAAIAALGEYEVGATVARGLAEVWRAQHGRANRKGGRGGRGYVDKVLAAKLQQIGFALHGREGKVTGHGVRVSVVPDGPLDLALRDYEISGARLRWRDAARRADGSENGDKPSSLKARKNTRTRWLCAKCEVKAWAGANTRLACLPCNLPLVTHEAEGADDE